METGRRQLWDIRMISILRLGICGQIETPRVLESEIVNRESEMALGCENRSVRSRPTLCLDILTWRMLAYIIPTEFPISDFRFTIHG